MRPYVYVVDDNFEFRELVERQLEAEGFDTRAAGSGREALRYLEECTEDEVPAVVFLDIYMPGLSGFEVLAGIESNERLRSIPIYVLSAKPGFDLPPRAAGWIEKPAVIERLVQIIRRHWPMGASTETRRLNHTGP